MFNIGTIMIIMIGSLAGVLLFLAGAIVNRRYDAVIRAREDYDEDVDGKQTKAEKAAFLKQKKEEEELLKLGAKDFTKFAWNERRSRAILFMILGVFFFVLSIAFFGVTPTALIFFLFYALLTLIAFIDLDTMEIPPSLNIAIVVLALFSLLVQGPTLLERGIGIICIAGPMMLINLIIPEAFGGGDIKLFLAAGALLGWKSNLMAFFAGAIVAAVVSIILILTKKKSRKEHIPFGPSLCVGYVIASLYGDLIVDSYIGMIKVIIEAAS